jgi:hypothetical protein
MEATDIVFTVSDGYTYTHLEPWIISLDKVGFKGYKVVVAYNMDAVTIEKLKDKGVVVFAFNQDALGNANCVKDPMFNVVVNRFFHYWYFMNKLIEDNKQIFRYAICTDARDVIFQTNPSLWLEKNLGQYLINVGSEGLRYKDEPWSDNNMKLSFGELIYGFMYKRPIYNAGTIAGNYYFLKDFFLQLFLACGRSAPHVPGGGGPDQSAMNLILTLEPYGRITKFNEHEEGWCCQCGTMADPTKINSFRHNLLEPEPKFKNGSVYTSKGDLFCMVHQYDRVPEWKLDEQYREKK